MAAVTVSIKTLFGASQPLNDVLVQVFQTNGVLVTEGETGALYQGETRFLLGADANGEDYDIILYKPGWRFPTSNIKRITVFDPPAPDNNFEYEAARGSESSRVVIKVVDDEPVPNPVDDVRVRVYDAEDNYVTEGVTVAGEYTTSLPATVEGVVYILRMYKPGYSFPDGSARSITVLSDRTRTPEEVPFGAGGFGTGEIDYPINSWEFVSRAQEIPESNDPDLCMLYGNLTTGGLRPLPGAEIRFVLCAQYPDTGVGGINYPANPSVVRNNIIISEHKGIADRDGFVQVALVRGGIYFAHVYGAEHPIEIAEIVYIPDKPSHPLEDVLLPYVKSVTPEETSLSLNVGDSSFVEVTAVSSDESEASPVGALIEYTSSDEGVATVDYEGDELKIVAVSAGTVTLTPSRVAGTWATRRPNIDALVTTPIEVTVS